MKETLLDIFLSGLGGSLIGGFCALLAVHLNNRSNEKSEVKRREVELMNYMQALHDELEVFWIGVSEAIGNKLSSSDERYMLFDLFPKIERPFPIFEGNVVMLGGIQQPELRRKIVKSYGLSKSFLAQLNFHNELLSKREHAFWKSGGNTSNEEFTGFTERVHVSTNHLKSGYNDADKSVKELLREFIQMGVLKI